jgi:hypothetical protein
MFEQSASGKMTPFNNDFTIIQWAKTTEGKKGLYFVPRFLFGFLRNDRRKGEFFERNTFKVGLPVYSNNYIFLQPQLLFNDFFKNVSPSLKFGVSF